MSAVEPTTRAAHGAPRVHVTATEDEIAATFDVMAQLRPELERDAYVSLVRRMMREEGYRIAALHDDGRVAAVAGYRILTMLHCGRLLYVDDLVTDAAIRSRGHGRALLGWLREEGRRSGCRELQLVSRVVREEAHRFYFREGLAIRSFHFRDAL